MGQRRLIPYAGAERKKIPPKPEVSVEVLLERMIIKELSRLNRQIVKEQAKLAILEARLLEVHGKPMNIFERARIMSKKKPRKKFQG